MDDSDGRGGSGRRRAGKAGAITRLAASYKANREGLEPLARLLVDVLAVVALLRRGLPQPPASGNEAVKSS